VFIDEAGSTGTNFLDDDQRWYVLSGLAISETKADGARAAVDRIRTARASKELKGSVLLATHGGRKVALEVLRAAGNAGCVPFFAVLEKRFNLAARFDHIISDPAVNHRVRWAEQTDIETRRSAAGALARVPVATLQRIQQAIRDPSATNWQAVIDECAAELRKLVQPDLATVLEGAREATVQQLFFPTGQVDAKEMSVNEAAFTTLVQLIDHTAVGARVEELELIHDETASFQGTIQGVYDRLRAHGTDDEPIYGPDGTKVWPLQAIRNLTFLRSHEEPLVQAADVHAAIMAWMTAMRRPKDFAGEQSVKKLSEVITGLLLQTDPRLVHTIVSDEDLGSIGRTLSVLRGSP